MARSQGQKLKILYLLKILTEETDESHPLTLAEIAERLADYGVAAERKSLYDDLEALRTFGYDIIAVKSSHRLLPCREDVFAAGAEAAGGFGAVVAVHYS